MIDLTLAQIADIVGGELADVSAADAAATRVTGTVEFDSRAVTPGGLFLALPGARSDGHDFAAAAVAAGAVAVLAARPVGVPAIVVAPRPTPAPTRRPACSSTTPTARVRRCSPRWPSWPPRWPRAGRGRADDRRRHRVVGQDVDQGPARRGARAARRGGRAARLVQQRARPPVDGAAGRRRTPTTWCWRCRRATRATSRRWRRSPRRRSRSCSTSAPPTSASSARARPSRDTKAELPQAVPSSGVVVLNADDDAGRRHGRADRRPGGPGVAGHRAPTCGPATGRARRGGPRPLHPARRRASRPTVSLAVHGDHQVSNALCAAAVALECGATGAQVAAALAGAGPVSQHRMHVTTRDDGVTVINDAYNANPDSMRAGLKSLAWMARQGGRTRRSWAVLGEMAELGDDAISEHDRIGRLAVRLDVSRLIVVGTGRPMSAMHQGAVMEGSWGGEAILVADADAALALLRAELRRGTWCWSRRRTRPGWGSSHEAFGAPPDEADPHRRRHRAGGVDPADPGADPAVHPAGFRPRDPRGRPAEPPQEARHPVDGRRRDPGGHLGGLPGHAPGRDWHSTARARRRRVCWHSGWPPRSASSASSTT